MSLLKIALSQYGIKEILGSNHNQIILDYAKETGFSWVNDDETPWCSIFMNWCAMKAGLQRTGKANARSWLDIGLVVSEPEVGDIVILKRGDSDWQGHVAIYINEIDEYINVLGGNQSNQVNISKYKKSDVLGYRNVNS